MTNRTEPWYWLNDNSRLFLERGYLLEGQTPDERIKIIRRPSRKYFETTWFCQKSLPNTCPKDGFHLLLQFGQISGATQGC